jgi:hypothetical protein
MIFALFIFLLLLKQCLYSNDMVFYIGERPPNCTAASWTFFVREAREHVRNPSWNQQQRKASQTHLGCRSKFGSGGARSFAQKFVSL